MSVPDALKFMEKKKVELLGVKEKEGLTQIA